jgi:hypothetical protein
LRGFGDEKSSQAAQVLEARSDTLVAKEPQPAMQLALLEREAAQEQLEVG